MSRERISNYKVTVASGNVTVHIVKPSGITLATELTVEDENIGTYYLIYDSQESKWYVDGASPVVYYTTDDISTVHVGSNVYREVEGEPVGAGVVTAIGYTADSQRIVTEAVRLILDETALVVFCSSMKKANISSIAPSAETNYDIAITFVIPTSKTVTATDAFTIEFDWALPMNLSNVAKQGTDPTVTLTGVDGKIDGFYDTFDADIALQLSQIIGDDNSSSSSSSNSSSQTAQQIATLRSLQQSYDSMATSIGTLTSLESDINAGKTALATAITNKGVGTLPTQSMQDMAQNISSIAQETIVLDGGEVYAKQLFGSPSNSVVPGFWNLYEVMAYLLTKTSTEQYSILLCEFPKGGATYAFGGANVSTPIPVGYVFSDDWQLTGEGSINIHPNTDTSHTWDDAIDTKGNHWIAWLFSQVTEGVTPPAISLGAAVTNAPQPRSIYIGRKIGNITLTANSAVREFVVIDGNKLNSFLQNGYSCNFLPTTIIRNTTILGNSYLSFASNVEKIFVHTEHVSLSQANGAQIITTGASSIGSIVIDCDDITIDKCWNSYIVRGVSGSSIGSIIIKANSIKCPHNSGNGDNGKLVRYVTSVKSIYLIGLEECSQFDIVYNNTPTTEYIYIGYDTNDKTKTVALWGSGTLTTLTDIELQDGWCKPLSISFATSLTESNIYAHILQRLKQDEAGCGDGVTIVLGQTNINKLTSNDNPNRVRDITLLNTLIGTYGYAFTGYTPITLE